MELKHFLITESHNIFVMCNLKECNFKTHQKYFVSMHKKKKWIEKLKIPNTGLPSDDVLEHRSISNVSLISRNKQA